MEHEMSTTTNNNGATGPEAKRAVGERSEGAGGRPTAPTVPDPELAELPKRRTFTADYKLKILAEVDAATEPGEIGALLRREGLYSSLLSTWRRQRDEGALRALGRKRGPKSPDPREERIAKLTRRAERAESRLATAQRVIEVQGNVSALLGDLLEPKGAAAKVRQ